MTRDTVYHVIDSERTYQDNKWGTFVRHPHEVGGYLTLMRSLLTRAEQEWSSKGGDFAALDNIRKLVAVGVACAEQHGLPSRA